MATRREALDVKEVEVGVRAIMNLGRLECAQEAYTIIPPPQVSSPSGERLK